MNYRVSETAYGPEIRFYDWASDEVDLIPAGGMFQARAPERATVTWRYHRYGGGGDVARRVGFRIVRIDADGECVLRACHRPRQDAESGFALACRDGHAGLRLNGDVLWAGAFDAAAPHEACVATLAGEYEVALDGNVIAAGRVARPFTDNEGALLFSLRDADVEVASLAEEFIEADVAVPAWKRGELLYEESFGEASLAEHWCVAGTAPVCEPAAFTFQPTSVGVLRQRFDGPLAVETLATPVPDDARYTAGVTDAIFLWMMEREDGDLFDYLESLPDARLPHFMPLPFYWVDFGGSNNMTTRLRKNPDRRLMRQFVDRARLLERDRTYRILTVQNGEFVEFRVDGEPWMRLHDPHPLGSGYVGYRAFVAPLHVSEMKVWRLAR